jgi:hypothetical protein
MHQCILALADAQPAGDPIQSRWDNRPVIDAERTDLLDGETIHHGEAVVETTTEEQEITVLRDDEHISTAPVETTAGVHTEWVADLDAEPAWVATDTADADRLWSLLGIEQDTHFERAELDVDGFASDYQTRDNAHVWHATNERVDESVSLAYHGDAAIDGRALTKMLGFEYRWDGAPVRGVMAESGYVAIYDGLEDVAALGRWMREEVLPYASRPEQQELGGGEA